MSMDKDEVNKRVQKMVRERERVRNLLLAVPTETPLFLPQKDGGLSDERYKQLLEHLEKAKRDTAEKLREKQRREDEMRRRTP